MWQKCEQWTAECLNWVPMRHQGTLSATATTLVWSPATHARFTQALDWSSLPSCFNIIQDETITLKEWKWLWPHSGNWTKSELLVSPSQNLSRHLSSCLFFDPSRYLLIFFVFYPIRVTAFVGHSRSLRWWVIMTVGTWVLWLLHHGVVLLFPLSSVITCIISELEKAANESLSTTSDCFVCYWQSTWLVHILCWISLLFWI